MVNYPIIHVEVVDVVKHVVFLFPFLIRMGVAFVCGALIGWERERSDKPAGLRTHVLICVGASIYAISGLLVGLDPTRVASQVASGVGFIGAGTILRDKDNVVGLTTAATVWLSAAIGVLAGLGYPIMAVFAAVLTLTTLTVLSRIPVRRKR